MIALALALAVLVQDVPEAEVVVIGQRSKCRMRLADRIVGERELSVQAGEWARLGTPVRVVAPRGASYKCLARIVFRLQDRGVRLVRWVDTPSQP